LRILVRYALFQLPALVLLVLILILVRRWVDLPTWFEWGLIGAWVVKDAVLFPFVWPSYARGQMEDVNSIAGERGIAEERLAPAGYVCVHGELWQAEVMGGGYAIDRGEGVRVQAIRGLTLLVQPDNEKIRE
jgi:membrane protein implicated in regulation of membrane protease activity